MGSAPRLDPGVFTGRRRPWSDLRTKSSSSRTHEPLYVGDGDELLNAVRELSACDEPLGTVLLVGHNPGVHQLVLELTAGKQAPGFPASALAVVTLDVDDWWQAGTGAGRLTTLHVPEDSRD